MNMMDVPVPAVYREESADFRFFQKWFTLALSKIQYDTEEFFDLLDPLRCPAQLLWLLGDTMGYKYDDRVSTAFNRLVLVYFMSMIRLKGSKDGLTLAAQVNLDQFKLRDLAEENDILSNRLEDTSIPSNSVYVQPHVEDGYIDLIYFSDQIPDDICTEYVRPVGMYTVPHAGVRYDANTKLNIDARLTDSRELNMSIGPTHVGHYSQNDYSRMQRLIISDLDETGQVRDTEGKPRYKRKDRMYEKLSDTRDPVWYRNSKYEGAPSRFINPGYRALYSLQLANGETSVRSMISAVRNMSSISPEDVNVENTETGEVFDNTYYRQESDRLAALRYTAPVEMGTMGSAMVSSTSHADTPSDEES